MPEWREMIEHIDWRAKQPSQVACFLEVLKWWEAWDTTCGHKVKDITPLIAWRREAWKKEALHRLPWKDERGPSSIRRTLEPFQRQLWGNFWETVWSAYGLYRAHRYHLELNWTMRKRYQGKGPSCLYSGMFQSRRFRPVWGASTGKVKRGLGLSHSSLWLLTTRVGLAPSWCGGNCLPLPSLTPAESHWELGNRPSQLNTIKWVADEIDHLFLPAVAVLLWLERERERERECVYVCMCVCVCVWACVHVSVYVCTHACVHKYACVCEYGCTHGCEYMRVCFSKG